MELADPAGIAVEAPAPLVVRELKDANTGINIRMSPAAGQSRRICVAVVGAGEFGRLHARVHRELESSELDGIYDRNSKRAK